MRLTSQMDSRVTIGRFVTRLHSARKSLRTLLLSRVVVRCGPHVMMMIENLPQNKTKCRLEEVKNGILNDLF
jgi:hypothetical protein